jgi:hypothetical protein
MIRVAMHQPNFLPYIGFFDKAAKADLLVIVDHVAFSKGKDNWHHRNRIRNCRGWDYITIPVSDHFNYKPFTSVTLNGNIEFKKRKHIKTFCMNYQKAPFFDDYFGSFSELYMEKENSLVEFNIKLIRWMIKSMGIKAKVVRSSELDFDLNARKTDMIMEIMENVGGSRFISGDGAKCYIEKQRFEGNGISMEFQNFRHPEYPQTYPGFIPNMSAMDLILNTGKSALKLIHQ